MKYLSAIFFGFIIIIFLFLRLYALNTSLEFYSDMGRDLDVLMMWKQTGKPPLLGPTISFFPLSQSGLYYFLIMPFFLISGASVYSAVYAILFYYLLFACVGYFSLRNTKHFVPFLCVALLVSFHPEFVYQLRYPWNPSFGPPFFFAGLFLFFQMLEGVVTRKRAMLFSICMAIPVAVSYSFLPVAGLLFLILLFRVRSRIMLFLSMIGAFLLAFFPVLLFEVRHNFFFLRRMMVDPFPTQQIAMDYGKKMTNYLGFLFNGSYFPTDLLAIVVFLVGIWGVVWMIRATQEKRRTQYLQSFFITCVAFVLLFALPFEMLSHYMFSVLCLILITISFLPKALRIGIIAVLVLNWTAPTYVQKYLHPARRTIEQMEQCAQRFCSVPRNPSFVASQGWFEHHFAADWIFLLNKHGCVAQDITRTPQSFSNSMIIVVDQSSYTHGKTVFNELSLFGDSKETDIFACEGNIRLHLLEREAR